MDKDNLASALFVMAEALQEETRELQGRITQMYNTAAQMKQLALAVAHHLNTPIEVK